MNRRDAFHSPQSNSRLRHLVNDNGVLRGLDVVGVEEWAEYELLNARAIAVYAMENDDDYFTARSRDIRSGYHPHVHTRVRRHRVLVAA